MVTSNVLRFGRMCSVLAAMQVLAVIAVSAQTKQASSDVRPNPGTLALGACDDTNLNFFLPATEARALVPSALGLAVVTPLFGGDTTPLNVAHFYCPKASVGGGPAAPVNFALVRLGLEGGGHYVMWVLTDSGQLHDALRAQGVDSHLVPEATLDIAGSKWTTTWGGDFSPYTVVAQQANRLATGAGRVDWVFSGSHGVVHITGSYTLTEEFGDRSPTVRVPEGSALRPYLNRARGVTALTHRLTLGLTVGAPR